MAEYVVKVEADGTVDIPSDVRDRLSLNAGDSMTLKIRGDVVELEKLPATYYEQAEEMALPDNEHPVKIR
jgi:AbrB family looped-hinge helix DNA binding protein